MVAIIVSLLSTIFLLSSIRESILPSSGWMSVAIAASAASPPADALMKDISSFMLPIRSSSFAGSLAISMRSASFAFASSSTSCWFILTISTSCEKKLFTSMPFVDSILSSLFSSLRIGDIGISSNSSSSGMWFHQIKKVFYIIILSLIY